MQKRTVYLRKIDSSYKWALTISFQFPSSTQILRSISALMVFRGSSWWWLTRILSKIFKVHNVGNLATLTLFWVQVLLSWQWTYSQSRMHNSDVRRKTLQWTPPLRPKSCNRIPPQAYKIPLYQVLKGSKKKFQHRKTSPIPHIFVFYCVCINYWSNCGTF